MVLRKLFSDSVVTTVSQLVSTLVPLCIFAVSSKAYGTAVFYSNLVTLSLMGFFSLVNDAGLYQYYVKCFSEDRYNKKKLGWWIGVVVSQKILTCLTCLLILFLLTFFDNYQGIINFLLIGTVGAVFQAFQPIWYYTGVEKMAIYAVANLLVKVSSLLLMYLLFSYFENDYIPVICFTFSNVILTVYLVFEIKRQRFTYSNVSLKDVLTMMSTARLYLFSRTLASISTYLIVLVLGVTEFSLAGVFAIADQIYKAVKLSVSPIVQVIIPYCIRTKDMKFLVYFSLVLSTIVLLLYFLIDQILLDVVNLIWGVIPENGELIIYMYTYAGMISMLNAVLGFPWFAILGFYDKANSSLILATFFSMTVLLYSFYRDLSFLAYVVVISELSLLVLRLLHLAWLEYKLTFSER